MSETAKNGSLSNAPADLAWMHLTARYDLLITRADSDVGLDYLVCLTKKDDKPSLRQFGIILRAERKPTTVEQLNKVLRPTMRLVQRVGEFPYPVCLLYFTMEDNRGYYTWVAEPILTEDGKPRLQKHAGELARRSIGRPSIRSSAR